MRLVAGLGAVRLAVSFVLVAAAAMGRLAAGRYATNKRLSDVSIENILDTFSYTAAEGRLPQLRGQKREEEEKVRRVGLDGVPRTARRSLDPMAVRWGRYKSASPSPDLRERMRSASPFMQTEQANAWAKRLGGRPGGGSINSRARPRGGAALPSSAKAARAVNVAPASVPWKDTSNEELFPYACKRCNACTAYQNGVAEVVGTSLRVCPWVISMDRAVRQVNAHLAGCDNPDPNPAFESTYQMQCRTGFLGAEEPADH